MVTPYYQEPGITIYHGDCLEVMPFLVDEHIAAVITDPPYGLNLGTANNIHKDSGYGGHLGRLAYESYEDSYEQFTEMIIPRLQQALKLGRVAAVFTGPHIHEQKKPTAIGGIYSPVATGRTPWGSKNFLPVLLYGIPHDAGQHRPTVLHSNATAKFSGHPCPKPVQWMRWLVTLASRQGDLILDPFMGSGTTLQAAKDLGRQCIGIEIEERYCEIAANRLRQGVFDFTGAMTITPIIHEQMAFDN